MLIQAAATATLLQLLLLLLLLLRMPDLAKLGTMAVACLGLVALQLRPTAAATAATAGLLPARCHMHTAPAAWVVTHQLKPQCSSSVLRAGQQAWVPLQGMRQGVPAGSSSLAPGPAAAWLGLLLVMRLATRLAAIGSSSSSSGCCRVCQWLPRQLATAPGCMLLWRLLALVAAATTAASSWTVPSS
jgi:hypothetical protein